MVNWKCKACAASLAGVCALHALIPADELQPILFYQDEGHPEPERAPRPQQENRVFAPTSASVMPSIAPGNLIISGDPAGNFSITWPKPVDGTVTLYVTRRPTDGST